MSNLDDQLRSYVEALKEADIDPPEQGRRRLGRGVGVAAALTLVAAAILAGLFGASGNSDVETSETGPRPAAGATSATTEQEFSEAAQAYGFRPENYDSPEVIAYTCGYPLIVTGELRGPGQLRQTTYDSDADGAIDGGYRWIPVYIEVSKVIRNYTTEGAFDDRVVEGAVIPVRLIEGLIDNEDGLRRTPAGTEVLLFLNPLIDVGDGLAAATPSVVYVLEDGIATSLSKRHTIALEEFEDLLREGADYLATEPFCAERAREAGVVDGRHSGIE